MVNERRICIIGGIIALSVTAIIGYVILLSRSCQFNGNKPSLDFKNMTRMKLEDGSVLADLEGYLSITNNEKTLFLPLKVQSMTSTLKNSVPCLEIASDCAKISITFETSRDRYVIDRISANFINNEKVHQECSTNMLEIYWRKDTHYSCRELKTYPCYLRTDDGNSTEVAKINIGLELEVGRDVFDSKKQPYCYQKPPIFCFTGN